MSLKDAELKTWGKGGQSSAFASKVTLEQRARPRAGGDRRLPAKAPRCASHPPLDPPYKPESNQSTWMMVNQVEGKIGNNNDNLGQVNLSWLCCLGYSLFQVF